MIQGIGTDLVEIARLKEACLKHADFPERVLTESELKLLKKTENKKRTIGIFRRSMGCKRSFYESNGDRDRLESRLS